MIGHIFMALIKISVFIVIHSKTDSELVSCANKIMITSYISRAMYLGYLYAGYMQILF